MDLWRVLMEILFLLGAAFVLGAAAERLRQNAIVGYLIAGAALGPFLFNREAVDGVAELGVALLLFSIGLEFSWRRLRSLGAMAFGGGTLQVAATTAIFAVIAAAFCPWSEAVALGAVVALSSTAVVLRVLVERTEIDSIRGRAALSILLLQDIAVVPLVLLVTLLGSGGGNVLSRIATTIAAAVGLAAVFYIVFFHVVPRLLLSPDVHRNRDLFVLLAFVAAIGSAWFAHTLGLSPALGAFVAGVLLGESPYAVQLGADIGSLRTLFVTLFFLSIGMLADPAWMLTHAHWVAGGVVVVVCGKAVITYGVARLFRQSRYHAMATGLTLAQIGEFSFVLATAARGAGVLSRDAFDLAVSVTIVTLFLTPYLVGGAGNLSRRLMERVLPRESRVFGDGPPPADSEGGLPILVVGLGPAGVRVVDSLVEKGHRPVLLELNARTARLANEHRLPVYIGNAAQAAVLEHLGVHRFQVVAVTVPDPRNARTIVEHVRRLAPDAVVVARARYHVLRWELEMAGAAVVIDEESHVGERMGRELARVLAGDNA